MNMGEFKPPFRIGQWVASDETEQTFVVTTIQWSGGDEYLVRCSWLIEGGGRGDLWMESWRLRDAEVGHA